MLNGLALALIVLHLGLKMLRNSSETQPEHIGLSMVVQYSQMFANTIHSITVFNEHLLDVCEDSSKCEN